jgi:DnaJ-class molecular chaperone
MDEPDEAAPAAPGDEAPLGTTATGEIECPKCHGTGAIDGEQCLNCAGSGW